MMKQNQWEALFDRFLNTIEFCLVKCPDGWGLEDRQGGNFGNIENDRFEDATGLIDRLDIYISDYFADDIKGAIGKYEFRDWNHLLEIARTNMTPSDLEQYRFDLDVLDMVCNHPEDIDLEKCSFITRDYSSDYESDNEFEEAS